jgi:hypothetical protein
MAVVMGFGRSGGAYAVAVGRPASDAHGPAGVDAAPGGGGGAAGGGASAPGGSLGPGGGAVTWSSDGVTGAGACRRVGT